MEMPDVSQWCIFPDGVFYISIQSSQTPFLTIKEQAWTCSQNMWHWMKSVHSNTILMHLRENFLETNTFHVDVMYKNYPPTVWKELKINTRSTFKGFFLWVLIQQEWRVLFFAIMIFFIASWVVLYRDKPTPNVTQRYSSTKNSADSLFHKERESVSTAIRSITIIMSTSYCHSWILICHDTYVQWISTRIL